MFGKQMLVALGMAVATAVVLIAWNGPLHPNIVLPLDAAGERIAFALKWLLVPGFTLLVGIAMVANRRFFSADAMDGTRLPQSTTLEINLRYIRTPLSRRCSWRSPGRCWRCCCRYRSLALFPYLPFCLAPDASLSGSAI
jgi:hypothetical protein